ncbi:ABC transporter G family member 32-like [Triticum dicoccoides]|uniref:ABC transporter G family member 32-like n=1 Tax=Triticum dicoccoides TaxID=85692 RepID=UPI000E7CC1F0|nr:ABC transporter G family member 32-like [Triticum dicoccoides]
MSREIHKIASLRRDSWRSSDDVFSRSSSRFQDEEDDEEALRWAALERLPTYDRVRRGILQAETGEKIDVDVGRLGARESRALIDRLVRAADDDHERFLLKLKDRMDRVGIDYPTIEVRFEKLEVEAEVLVGNRALPTLVNSVRNTMEAIGHALHIFPRRKHSMTILHDVSGIIKPRRMTLLLGPPRSGKTTLLLALAGKLDKELKVSGKVSYNGYEMNEFVPERTAAYISQHDLHTGEMTVRETLAFSARCQGVGSRYEMLTELARRENTENIKPDNDIDVYMKASAMGGQEYNVVTEYILKVLGLDICADTVVGNDMLRGISGGQRKRVTTGEMLVGPARALFMDEISTGLDSSTTYQIVNSIRQTIHVLGGTAVISLLQPAPETYDLFDDIILLSDGYVVYQGAREHVLEFFESMGFRCPQRKGVADFLQEVTSRKDQEQYWYRSDMPYHFVPVKQFADSFHSFHMGQFVHNELLEPFDRTKSHPAALATSKFGVSRIELLKATMDREFLLMKRNSFYFIFKAAQLSLMAFLAMSTFFRTNMHRDPTYGTIYMGALYFAIDAIMFNGFSELGMTATKLPVFFKQRDLLFFPAWAYTIPAWILQIPITFFEVGVYVFTTYYVIGFDPSVSRLFKQYMLLLALNQMSSSLFRFIAGLGRDMVVSSTFGPLALASFTILGGFILARPDVKKWWIWGYWVSPLSYAQNAISTNEFLVHSWNKILPGQNDTMGIMVLKSRGIFTEAKWYWIGFGAMIGYTLLFNLLYTLALSVLNPLGDTHPTMPENAIKEKHANVTGEILEDPEKKKCRNLELSDSTNQNCAINNVDSSSRRKGMVLPFAQLSLSFNAVKYSVDMPQAMLAQGVTDDRLVLLKGVSGSFRPGVLTALMGVSGAGKTTLMDVLAGRKTGGYIEGDITISGYPKKQETFARISGYCEQNDIHSPHVTVYESLAFSAWLRLISGVDLVTRKMFIEEVMELVELTSLRGALVGLPGVNGLSTEQRKRLTIAVELVANPSIIFMDEPTSGLDARAAAIVMRAVRNTVNTGRTVVCTIHQPSIDIFEAFDELFLMKRGGEEIYVGPLGHNSSKLIEYFEGIEGVSKIKDGYNPATWMLEVTSIVQEEMLGVDFCEIYRRSELYQRNKELIEELSTPHPDSSDLDFPSQYSRSFFTQCLACLWKQKLSYWRNPSYTAMRFLFTVIIALLFGTMFWGLGQKTRREQDLFNAVGSMYAAVLYLGIQNSGTVQPVVAVERTVFYRERAAGMYSAFPYAFGQVAIEFPYILVQTVIYGVLVYSMIGFEWSVAKFFWYLFFMYFTLLYFTFYGMMAVGLTPNESVAAIISGAVYNAWNLFSGYLIPRPKIPVWWRWYSWICPVAWTLYGLVASQFGDIQTKLVTKDQTVAQFIAEFYGFDRDLLWVVAVVHVAFTVGFAFMFSFAIMRFNFQRR